MTELLRATRSGAAAGGVCPRRADRAARSQITRAPSPPPPRSSPRPRRRCAPLRDAAVSKAHEQHPLPGLRGARPGAPPAAGGAGCPRHEPARRTSGSTAVRRRATERAQRRSRASVGPRAWTRSSRGSIASRRQLAAQTTSALLAARPGRSCRSCRQRLRQTDSCRGLALVAGVLAQPERGRGRRRGGLRAGGRGEVRRPRAVRAVAGPGRRQRLHRPARRHRPPRRPPGRPRRRRPPSRRRAPSPGCSSASAWASAARRDRRIPAILGAARAALAPLVTLAKTERTQPTRCAGGARRPAGARSAATRGCGPRPSRQSQGRTLRCQAPPTR